MIRKMMLMATSGRTTTTPGSVNPLWCGGEWANLAIRAGFATIGMAGARIMPILMAMQLNCDGPRRVRISSPTILSEDLCPTLRNNSLFQAWIYSGHYIAYE